MKKRIHIQKEDEDVYIFCNLYASLHWKNIEQEKEEVPKCILEWCLKNNMQNEILSRAESNLFFNGIDREALGGVDRHIEIFKSGAKLIGNKKMKMQLKK